jgi:hypothetical protein
MAGGQEVRRLAPSELQAVDEGLALFLGLGDRLEPVPTSVTR